LTTPSLTADTGGHITGFGSKPYRSYVLTALTVVYILNFVDRQLLSVVGPKLKPELGLSDTMFGLLTGPAFAVLYTMVGLPLARVAEVKHRVWIMTICVALWSLMTVLCGFSREVTIGSTVIAATWVLFTCRIGVGIGEAGCTPPATSLISDYYPASKRSTALGYYAMGVTLGTVMANLIGGPVTEHFGWRMAFIVVGAPGILIATVLKLTIKEPPRGYSDAPGTVKTERSTIADGLKVLLSKRSFWFMTAGTTLASFCGYGITSFQSLFMNRTFHLTTQDASLYVNAPVAFASAMGTLLTGWLAEKMIKKYPTAIAWIPGFGLMLSVPFYLMAFMTGTLWLSVAGLIIGGFVKYGYLAAQYTIATGVVSMRVRATSTAVLIFMQNMIGYSLGPLFIGAVSDIIFKAKLADLGMTAELTRKMCETVAKHPLPAAEMAACKIAHPESLQDAMLICACIYGLAGLLLAWSSRYLKKDMETK
jgi:MFS family permease